MIDQTTHSLVELVKDEFPARVLKDVDKLDGQLTDAVLKRFLLQCPAVYFTFVGGRSSADSADFRINANWVAYIVTSNKPKEIGPDDIIKVLAPLLHGHTIEDVGTVFCSRIENLFSISKDKKGARVHAITLTMPNFSFDYAPDMSTLEPFITYHAEHSMTEGNEEPAAIDEITLDQ